MTTRMNKDKSKQKDSKSSKIDDDASRFLYTHTPVDFYSKITANSDHFSNLLSSNEGTKIVSASYFNTPNYLITPNFHTANIVNGLTSPPIVNIYDPITRQLEEDQKLSNIHEPLSNLEKRVYELERQNMDKDRRIKQLENLQRRKRRSKTKHKTKPSQILKIRKELALVKKKLSTYDHEWRFTKDMHAEEAKDTTDE